jgi:3-isopropylmalate dehydrogenase
MKLITRSIILKVNKQETQLLAGFLVFYNITIPLSILLSVYSSTCCKMFEDAFGLKEEAAAIRAVVNKSLEQGIVTEDLAINDAKVYKTSEVGDWLVANL